MFDLNQDNNQMGFPFIQIIISRNKQNKLPPLSRRRGGRGQQQVEFSQPMQPMQSNFQDQDNYGPSNVFQQNKENEKNMTDGEILIPPDPQFFEMGEEMSILDTRDTMEGLAIQIDEKNIEDKSISYYIENIQKQNFYKASQQQSEKFELQKEKKQQELLPENIEDKLFALRNDINSLFSKLAQYLQGFVAGLTLMHALLLQLQSDDKQGLLQYCEPSLRLNQMLYCFSLVSVIGALFSIHICSTNKANGANQSRVRPIISSIFYGISYILIMYSHQLVSQFNRDSSNMSTLYEQTYESKYSNFKVVNILIGLTSCLGWLAVINANEIEVKPLESEIEEKELAKKEA